MGVATLVRKRVAVMGNKRCSLLVLTTTSASDTYTEPAVHRIDSVSLDSSTTAGAGVTFAGNVLTIVTAGGIANLPVIIYGS